MNLYKALYGSALENAYTKVAAQDNSAAVTDFLIGVAHARFKKESSRYNAHWYSLRRAFADMVIELANVSMRPEAINPAADTDSLGFQLTLARSFGQFSAAFLNAHEIIFNSLSESSFVERQAKPLTPLASSPRLPGTPALLVPRG